MDMEEDFCARCMCVDSECRCYVDDAPVVTGDVLVRALYAERAAALARRAAGTYTMTREQLRDHLRVVHGVGTHRGTHLDLLTRLHTESHARLAWKHGHGVELAR